MTYSKKFRIYGINRRLLLGISAICIIAIVTAGYFYYMNTTSKEADSLPGDRSKKSPPQTMAIIRARYGMHQGELLDISRVELVEVPVEFVPKDAVSSLSKLDNIRLKREVAEKEFLNALDFTAASSPYEEGDRLIEHNFAEGAVPAEATEGSMIDIKLFVKGEEDKVVISKIEVVSRNASLLSFYMNKQEQEFVKEAAAEGLLFAVKYADTSQPASEVTYVPSYSKIKR